MRSTNKRYALGNRKRSYLLAHRIRSDRSGMAGSTATNQRGKDFRYYVELNPVRVGGNKLLRVAADRIEQAVWDALVQMLTPTVVRDGLIAYRQQQQGNADTRQQQITTLERERATLEARHRKLIAAFEQDAITIEDLRDSKERTTAAIDSIDRELARLQQSVAHLMTAQQEHETLTLIEQMHESLRDLDDDEKQAVLEALDVQIQMNECNRQSLSFTITTLIGSMVVQAAKGAELSVVSQHFTFSISRLSCA